MFRGIETKDKSIEDIDRELKAASEVAAAAQVRQV